MKKDHTTLEDLLTDEAFLDAYDGRNGSRKAAWREWIEWSEATRLPPVRPQRLLRNFLTAAFRNLTREIGIRKALGASPASIVRLLSKEFLILTGVSALIAFPLGGWAMQSWLSSFAYRTDMTWWIFAAAGGLAIAITLITISFRALGAARTDPVKILRHIG
jgi:hypothetical protein